MRDMEPTVSAVYVYPVKSCRGMSLPCAYLSSTGFRWDRNWMVVNSRGRMVTQRIKPTISLVEVSIDMETLDDSWDLVSPHSALCLKAPGMEPISVPLKPVRPLEKVECSVWEWSGLCLDEGTEVAAWFSMYLGIPARLVRFDIDDALRPTDPKYAARSKVTFTDGFPLLVISQSSLDALNERLADALPINRFRPNIVIQDSKPFAEDLWTTFTIGKTKFHGVKLCSRCKVTTIDQQTGEAGNEPLNTLRSFRAGQLISSLHCMKNQVYFGQNVTFDYLGSDDPSFVAVGDPVQVLQEAACPEDVMNV